MRRSGKNFLTAFASSAQPASTKYSRKGARVSCLFVGPLVAARAGVVLAVKLLPLADAVVDVPGLADQGLSAGLAHS